MDRYHVTKGPLDKAIAEIESRNLEVASFDQLARLQMGQGYASAISRKSWSIWVPDLVVYGGDNLYLVKGMEHPIFANPSAAVSMDTDFYVDNDYLTRLRQIGAQDPSLVKVVSVDSIPSEESIDQLSRNPLADFFLGQVAPDFARWQQGYGITKINYDVDKDSRQNFAALMSVKLSGNKLVIDIYGNNAEQTEHLLCGVPKGY